MQLPHVCVCLQLDLGTLLSYRNGFGWSLSYSSCWALLLLASCFMCVALYFMCLAFHLWLSRWSRGTKACVCISNPVVPYLHTSAYAQLGANAQEEMVFKFVQLKQRCARKNVSQSLILWIMPSERPVLASRSICCAYWPVFVCSPPSCLQRLSMATRFSASWIYFCCHPSPSVGVPLEF